MKMQLLLIQNSNPQKSLIRKIRRAEKVFVGIVIIASESFLKVPRPPVRPVGWLPPTDKTGNVYAANRLNLLK